MSVRQLKLFTSAIALIALQLMIQSVFAAAPADWSGIETRSVKLFYPGQSSYQWVRSKDHKKAFNKVRKGEACLSCHEEEEEDIGDLLVSGERLEPHAQEGKPGSIDLLVQAAYDADNAYLRFQWKTAQSVPGVVDSFWQFGASGWESYGASHLDKDVIKGNQPAIKEDRLAIMMDDGSVPMFAEQGCWLTCHDGMPHMKKEANKAAIDADPLLGAQLHAKEVRKYLPGSRLDKRASWSKAKSIDEINALKTSGEFVDLMQWRGNRTNSVGMADDGYILEYRHSDEGTSVFNSNWDAVKKQPLFMFDESKTGFKAKTANDYSDVSKDYALVPELNAIAFDSGAGWKAGDLLPKYVVSRANASGSAADNQDVKANWKDGMWTVVWTRKLNTGNPDDKVLKPNSAVAVGFAVHDNNMASRGHYVSFPLTLGFGAEGDIDISAVAVNPLIHSVAE